MICFPVAHIQGTKMIKRNLHFKAPLVFMGGTLVKDTKKAEYLQNKSPVSVIINNNSPNVQKIKHGHELLHKNINVEAPLVVCCRFEASAPVLEGVRRI